jgi:hypothetical protein
VVFDRRVLTDVCVRLATQTVHARLTAGARRPPLRRTLAMAAHSVWLRAL